jgi:hypothetical protein
VSELVLLLIEFELDAVIARKRLDVSLVTIPNVVRDPFAERLTPRAAGTAVMLAPQANRGLTDHDHSPRNWKRLCVSPAAGSGTSGLGWLFDGRKLDAVIARKGLLMTVDMHPDLIRDAIRKSITGPKS